MSSYAEISDRQMFHFRPVLVAAVVFWYGVATGEPAEQGTVYGEVTDRFTGKPVELANLFLANTTIGVSTGPSGTYTITGIPPGSYELVASRVGYELDVTPIRVSTGDSLRKDFRLTARIIPEKEIQITALDPVAWRELLGIFKDEFIGTGDMADDCTLLNPEVLELERDPETDVLIARTDSVLHFENRSLGYGLHVLLSDFQWNRVHNRLFYKHYARFELLAPEGPGDADRWAIRRADVYRGSKRHFLKSLFAGTTQKEKFAIFRGTVNQILRNEGWYVEPENFTFVERVSPDYVRLSFQGLLRIQYSGEEGLEMNYIALPEGPAFVDANGFVLEPRYLTVLSQSVWAGNRIAHLLPLDYKPPKPGDARR